MILHGVVAYLAGLWLGPFLSLFPLSLLGALLSFGFSLTWLEQRGSLSRWGGLFLFAVVVAGMGHAHWAAMSKIDSPLRDLRLNILSIFRESLLPRFGRRPMV